MRDGTSQLFSLDRTSLTRSELKRPPCLKELRCTLPFRGRRHIAHTCAPTYLEGPEEFFPHYTLPEELRQLASISSLSLWMLHASCKKTISERLEPNPVGRVEAVQSEFGAFSSLLVTL